MQLVWQNFIEPSRHQLAKSEFVGGLSILDSLMVLGIDQTVKQIHAV
ncbi:MAG: hypothetical protein EBX92_10115 [Actinobacteria bacterium]|nr:hypothetical protein [Actinomycetota bacterium]